MRERERAEQLWQKLTRLEAAQDAQDIYIAREYVDLIVAFSREERARALEEFVQYVERKRWTGHLKDLKTLPQYMAEFKALREDGR